MSQPQQLYWKQFLTHNAPGLLWLLVFVPAASYFGATRWSIVASHILLLSDTAPAADEPTDVTTLSWKASQEQEKDGVKTVKDESCLRLMQLFGLSSSSYCRKDTDARGDDDSTTNETTRSISLPTSKIATVVHTQPQNDKNSSSLSFFPIQHSVWRHDYELGRGYLLFSTQGDNRVWRWERGGGPIPIGRSLHLDYAGCRPDHIINSKECRVDVEEKVPTDKNQNNDIGAGPLALDFWPTLSENSQHNMAAHSGSLLLAEYGEGRIVRLEDENGARTPVALLTTMKPRQLLMTPMGDLLVLFQDDKNDPDADKPPSSSIYIVRQAMTVPPLPSLRESRLAHNHSWVREQQYATMTTTTTHDSWTPQVFWSGNYTTDDINNNETATTNTLGGMTLTSDWTWVLVSMATQHKEQTWPLLYQLSLVTDDDDDDDDDKDDEEEQSQTTATSSQKQPDMKLLFNLTEHIPSFTHAGPLVVTDAGLIYWVVNDVNIVILHMEQAPLSNDKAKRSKSFPDDNMNDVTIDFWGYLTLPQTVTSITAGGREDAALYVTTERQIFKLHAGAGKWPTHPPAPSLELAPKHQRQQLD